ncbi:hypothetical protein ACF0H5_021781 [Mactra antiquata]
MECTKKKIETMSKRKAEENCGEDETIYIPDIDVSDQPLKEKQESSTKLCGSSIDSVSVIEVNRKSSDTSGNVNTDNLECDLIDIDSNEKEEEQVDAEKKDDVTDESSKSEGDLLAESMYDNVEVDDINDIFVNQELEKFSQMQEKLEERRRMAISKLNKIIPKKDMKTVTVIYRARDNLGVTVEVSKDANVQFVIDAVCASIDAQILPPKFVLTSAEGGKLHLNDGAEDTMHLLEEEYNMDDTITNYDDVIF